MTKRWLSALLVLVCLSFNVMPVAAQTTPEADAELPSSSRGYGGLSEAELRRLGIIFTGEGYAQSCPINGGNAAAPPVDGSFTPDPAAVAQFNEDLKPKIAALAPLYQRAAQEEGLADWELLPALHNLEFGLLKENPTTNSGFRGPFQMSANSLRNSGIDPLAPPYDSGRKLNDDEFVEQAKTAIRLFIRGKANHFDIDITQPLSPEDVAKIIVAYKSGEGSAWFDGRADFNLHAYAWAGFDSTPQHKLPMAWGPGSPFGDEQPNLRLNKVGAATLFNLLKGTSLGSCAVNGAVRQRIVALAQQELGLWLNGTLSPGSGYKKYSQNREENWCADFVSWVYKEAGVSLSEDNGGNVPAVESIKQIGIRNNRYHDLSKEPNYVPLPGDIAIRQNGESHVNIVISVDGNDVTIIGGNQGGGAGQGESFTRSRVSQYTTTINDEGVSGYVSPE